MLHDRTIFWSHFEAYEECPQKFLWKYGWGVIDLGRGPGRGKPIPKEAIRSAHSALMGNVLSEAIERLYNEEWWREPATLAPRLTSFVEKIFALKLEKTFIQWDENWVPGGGSWDKSPPRSILLQTCLDGILNYLRTMKRNRLLGPYARSEVDLSGCLPDRSTKIAGRPDLIVRREDTGISILDGKNSESVGRYTNPDQLRWYALCFYLAHNVLPSRLGFVYFRYPEGCPPKATEEFTPPPAEEWTGIVDVPVVKEEIKLLAHRSAATRKVMLKELFDPSPSTKACKFCEFQTVCPAFASWKEANKRKPKKPTTEIEKAISEADGIIAFGGGESPRKT